MKQRFSSQFIDQAYQLAQCSPRAFNAAIACTLVHRNRTIVCSATNLAKTHPLQKRFGKNRHAIFLHAENNCILTAIRKGFPLDDFKNCSMYLARACKTDVGEFYPGLCRPCRGCQASILKFGIRNVYYTTELGVEQL